MKKLLLTAALCTVLSGAAEATYYKRSSNVNVNHNQAKAKAKATSKATSRSRARANASGGNATGTYSNTYESETAAASASAPALTSSNDTCMGSTSAGGQGVGFGFSFGSTWEDEDCKRRKNARFLHNTGNGDAAVVLMCKDKEVREAIMVAGTPRQKALCSSFKRATSHKTKTKFSYND